LNYVFTNFKFMLLMHLTLYFNIILHFGQNLIGWLITWLLLCTLVLFSSYIILAVLVLLVLAIRRLSIILIFGREIITLQSNNNQSGFGRQRRKFVLLSASHSTRVSTLTTSISGPGLYGCVPIFTASTENLQCMSRAL